MIFTEFLLAPTVPSLPRPKNTARVTSSGSVENFGSQSRLRCVTSSTMPTVKCRFGCRLRQFVEDGRHHGRREFLRRQPVAAADDRRHRAVAACAGPALDQRRDHVLVERLAQRPRLFGAVEDGDLLHRLRQGRDEAPRCQRAEEPDLHKPDLLALRHAAASTVSSTTPTPEPMITITRSASGAPT